MKIRFDIVEVLLTDGAVREIRHLPNTFPLSEAGIAMVETVGRDYWRALTLFRFGLDVVSPHQFCLQAMENGTTVKTAMGRILEIALNIFLVLFGLEAWSAGWVFIRVLKRSEDPGKNCLQNDMERGCGHRPPFCYIRSA